MSDLVIDPREAAVRFSLAKLVDRSPLHYYDAIQRGFTEPTLSMRIGDGAHAKLFGGKEIVIYRGGVKEIEKVKKGKKGQPDTVEIVKKEYSDRRDGAMWEEFKEKHAGKLILNEKENAIAERMALAIAHHPDADRLLFAAGTRHEHKIEWLLGGRRCQGTIDALGPVALLDLKGVQNASPRRFPYQARQMHWFVQAIWYADGCELAGLGERKPYLVAVENSPPFCVQVYDLTDDDIEYGRATYNRWLDVILECEESGIWPGYSSGVLPLNVRYLPPPAEPDEDAEDEDVDDLESSGDDIAA